MDSISNIPRLFRRKPHSIDNAGSDEARRRNDCLLRRNGDTAGMTVKSVHKAYRSVRAQLDNVEHIMDCMKLFPAQKTFVNTDKDFRLIWEADMMAPPDAPFTKDDAVLKATKRSMVQSFINYRAQYDAIMKHVNDKLLRDEPSSWPRTMNWRRGMFELRNKCVHAYRSKQERGKLHLDSAEFWS